MKTSNRYLLSVAACLGLAAGAGRDFAADANRAPVFILPSDVKWVAASGMTGAWRAALWGDPTKGAYGSFNKWSSGTEAPLHAHSFDSRVVMIQGTLVLTADGRTTELVPGSYGFMPAKHAHSTKCKAGTDCIFFAQQPGMFDSKTVLATTPGK